MYIAWISSRSVWLSPDEYDNEVEFGTIDPIVGVISPFNRDVQMIDFNLDEKTVARDIEQIFRLNPDATVILQRITPKEEDGA